MSTSRAAHGASRSARRRKERAKQQRKQSFPVFWAIVAGIVVLFAITFLLTRSEPVEDPGRAVAQTSATEVAGDTLPPLDDPADDAAVGMTAPEASGTDFDGQRVAISDDGRPKLIMFLAHWCSHCQAEVPVVQGWLNQKGFPEGVNLYSVSTSVDENQPNYPASDWLEREGWRVPVIRDDAASSVAAAYGVNGFPFFVFVDADGKVVQRASGELPIETIEANLANLR